MDELCDCGCVLVFETGIGWYCPECGKLVVELDSKEKPNRLHFTAENV